MKRKSEKKEVGIGFTGILRKATIRFSRVGLLASLFCLFFTPGLMAGEGGGSLNGGKSLRGGGSLHGLESLREQESLHGLESLPGLETADDKAFSTYLEWMNTDTEAERSPFDFDGSVSPPTPSAGSGVQSPSTEKNYLPPDMHSIGWIGTMEGVSGVGVGGALPTGISYELRYSGEDSKPDIPFFQAIEQETAVKIDHVDVEHAYAGSLMWKTPFHGLELGGSLFYMRMKADVTPRDAPFWMLNNGNREPSSDGSVLNSATAWMASARKEFGKLSLTADYYQNRFNFNTDGDAVTERIGEGYQGGAAYRLTPWLELGSSYSIYFADKYDKEGEAWTATGKNAAEAWIRDFGVSARFDITPNWMFKFEGHFMNGLIGAVQGADEDWTRFGAQMTLKF
ncbi:MAG: hypothetical protein GY859_12905 [Desulfobacterales bacterium]|nr:hypothetical protein [Desulfobacterales bacterium]